MIGGDGEQLGILSTDEAVKMALERGLDLVEVSPMARPPVCRVMDYGKFKYTQKKKQGNAKKHSMNQTMKEVKLRPKTEEHDYQFKLKHILRFLQEGNKAKVTVRFRGREMAHKDIGLEMLHRIIKDVGDFGLVSGDPSMEGRILYMVLSPSPKALIIARRNREEARRLQAENGGEEKKNAESEEELLDLDDDEDDDEDEDEDEDKSKQESQQDGGT